MSDLFLDAMQSLIRRYKLKADVNQTIMNAYMEKGDEHMAAIHQLRLMVTKEVIADLEETLLASALTAETRWIEWSN